MAQKHQGKQKKYEGVISPAAWDDNDNIASVCLLTHDDEEYLIGPPTQEEMLMDLLDEEVEVTGSTYMSMGEQYINVRSFRLVDEITGEESRHRAYADVQTSDWEDDDFDAPIDYDDED